MQPTDDSSLFRRYAESHSEEAFAALVTRHVNLVYSVALRHVGNPHNAEEITQAVFIILAKKAAQLREVKALSSWLFQATRLTANNFIRSETRRHHREEEAHMQSILNEPEAEVWPRIAPLLDTAVAGLREKDRQTIVLRFYEGRNLREVGLVLGASEDAAEKRVTRALEKLRKFFSKRGVSSTTAIIAGVISTNSIQAAPVTLAAAVTVPVSKGATISATMTTLVKGTMKTMTWIKIKFAIGIGVATMLVGGVATIALSGEKSGDGSVASSSAFQLCLVLDSASPESDKMIVSTTNRLSGEVSQEILYVQKKVLLDHSAIESASVATNGHGGQQIDFTLTKIGQEQFAKLTRENIGRRLAIVVDGKVVSAPVIRSEIPNGRGQITGTFTADEARNIAAAISNQK
jgi:RNA polymerase sigma factor (sigma-70 family)